MVKVPDPDKDIPRCVIPIDGVTCGYQAKTYKDFVGHRLVVHKVPEKGAAPPRKVKK